MAPAATAPQGAVGGGGVFTDPVGFLRWILFDPSATVWMSLLILAGEVVLNTAIINVVPYTEIDWGAYMDEVEGVVNGTYDYTQLRGDTGPLVYPAGFVYIFLGFYYATDLGVNILRAQYMFIAVYVALLGSVHCVYNTTKLPPYTLIFLSLSYRMHSIFVLRLFNDPPAMLLLYIAIILLQRHRWWAGCFLFSLAVSVKMNVLLFAPGLLFLLLLTFGFVGTIPRLALCAAVQLALGLPFLLDNPVGYIVRAFNFGRQFDYTWTVNWRLIPEETFADRRLHLALLGMHIAVVALFWLCRWSRAHGPVSLFQRGPLAGAGTKLTPTQITAVLFTSNAIGMAFARSLHYQFYVWYFHTLPWLLWFVPAIPDGAKIALMVAIEYCWNVYPSTPLSSGLLHGCHALLVAAVWFGGMWPAPRAAEVSTKKGQ
mmetsp:Transcript_28406/g.74628  ORF Transcript_28406/g.74628 Transcript_28406/m.74628 type:complete len:428 (+) Transcript_28406:260-1543(+)